jgi:DNA-binding transcriptional LysR family regulator
VIRTDLTTLRVFLAVYNLKNITKAAEREHIAPSAVSKRIQDLEAELDTQLFYRHPRGVTATPAGEALAGHTQRIFEGVNQMAVELSAFARGTRGQVRIHAHASAVSQYLPAEIATFVHLYPEVRVILREETSPNVLQSTLDGIADIGIFASLPAPPGLQVLSYREDQLVALLPVGHPLAGREGVDFREIRESDHISLETGSSLQVLLVAGGGSDGVHPQHPHRGDDLRGRHEHGRGGTGRGRAAGRHRRGVRRQAAGPRRPAGERLGQA